jgi:hypothetical protein
MKYPAVDEEAYEQLTLDMFHYLWAQYKANTEADTNAITQKQQS